MSAALVAGRARLKTVVVNSENPRNAVTTASHGFLTRDGVHPLELLRIGKEQLQKYRTVRYETVASTDVRKQGDKFRIELSNGDLFEAKRVIIATGFKDDLTRLNLPGIEAVYGKSVYPCPFCDGFEHADEALAVFGGPGVEHFVPVVKVWSTDLVVFTNGEQLSPEANLSLERNDVRIVEEPISRLISNNGKLTAIELASGERVKREAGFIADDCSIPSSDFAESLGVTKVKNDWGMDVLEADAAGKTNVYGVFVAGDAKNGFGGLVLSANEGSVCAESIVHEIAQERWR